MSNGLASLFWFVAILALIPLSLWLLKRTPIGGAGGAGVIRSIGTLPISTNQRIVTVEVGAGDERRWLVLGVTPSSITTLHTMDPQDDAVAAPPMGPPGLQTVGPAFAQVLAKLRRGKDGSP
ncbi:FliO/MopB family protein [Piscinibacter koreensis]|uniref:Flagellar biosynthetic protein FliO n=1 Tax=Piscinibacter koreensis TaxID=2742824 RepID=A0A7Y6TWC0_9BURK|nr:flagellar biosynthetic protein FliO [Schlegelella koreensis]NUZ05930.1 flagellar biosynthetic protein FliO [Schlegelella koreensis]